jgi:hypothetical protein
MGVKNVGLMAASVGPHSEPRRVVPAVQPMPDPSDQALLRFQLNRGMPPYVSRDTGEPIPCAARGGHEWDDLQSLASRFHTLEAAPPLFERYVRAHPRVSRLPSGPPSSAHGGRGLPHVEIA